MSELPYHLRNLRARSATSLHQKHHGIRSKASKRSDKTQKSGDEIKDDYPGYPKKKKHSKQKNRTGSNQYPTNTRSNSDGYAYKRSNRSGTSLTARHIEETVMLDEVESSRLSRKKTWSSTFTAFGLVMFLLLVAIGITTYVSGFEVGSNPEDYKHTYASVTHKKYSLMTDSLACSKMILKLSSNHTRGKGSNPLLRIAAMVHSICFGVMATQAGLAKKEHVIAKPAQMAVLSWGNAGLSNSMSPGPVLIHNANPERMDFEKVLCFRSNTFNTSFFGEPMTNDIKTLNDTMYQMGLSQLPGNISETKIKTAVLFHNYTEPLINAFSRNRTAEPTFESPLVNPLHVNLLHMNSLEKFGGLQFVSSGPNTLGVIAHTAILTAISVIEMQDNPDEQLVDDIVTQSLIHALDEFAAYYSDYGNFPGTTAEEVQNIAKKIVRDGIENTRYQSIVKFNSTSASVNLMFLDGRNGWPSLFHFSLSSPGRFFLSFNGKKTEEMINTCQVVVIQNGYLWMTAAASGQRYLLDKVVSSIVHRIIFNTEPLATINRKRIYYDTWDRRIKNQVHDDSLSPFEKIESLQFSQYDRLTDSFRSWLQPKDKWNLPTGI